LAGGKGNFSQGFGVRQGGEKRREEKGGVRAGAPKGKKRREEKEDLPYVEGRVALAFQLEEHRGIEPSRAKENCRGPIRKTLFVSQK